MFRISLILIYLPFLCLFYCQASIQKGIYKLPDLVIETNSTYLLRGVTTKLECQIGSTEWGSIILDRIYWMKNGVAISELDNEADEIVDIKGVLHIKKASHSTEGEYQCSAILRNIRLAEDKIVDSRLVSAPIKLRRARITKFERYISEAIRVKAGDVARLPCFGLPDVVPGPPDIWFEKQGNEGVQLGRTGNQRFISTSNGLQIALSQVMDSGRYYCMVRNSFLNVTRAAPKPIVLRVDPSDRYRRPTELRQPKIIYPISRNYTDPIEMHVVEGDTVILECVISDSVIRWDKLDYSMPKISIDNDRERIRQIWGNLKIKRVTVSDSDIYVCHGLREYSDIELRQNNHPKVIYKLIVHAPTNVRLTLSTTSEKSLHLSCYAQNLLYEIPMVYINGLALIETMNEMGIPPQTNFYTNPINVTLKANNPLSGSVQCISRPASEEAEIYGTNLERGRSMNLYVDNKLELNTFVAPQETTSSTSIPITQTDTSHSTAFQLHKPVVFMNSDNARVQWTVEAPDEKLNYLKEFVVEYRQRDPMQDNSVSLWTQSERIPAHVKAVTLKRLNPAYQYQFRTSALLTNGYAEIYSPATDWIGFQEPKTSVPFVPHITRIQTISHSSILVGWEHSAGSRFNVPEDFIIRYLNTKTNEVGEIKIGNISRELLITELDEGSEYEITVIAENSAGRSESSKPKIISTYMLVDSNWTILNFNGTAFLAFVTLISAAIPAICFLLILLLRKCYSSREMRPRSRNSFQHMRAKENVFNNQLYQDPLFLNNDPLDELSPLNYSLEDRDQHENQANNLNFAEKPFANIRDGQNIQRGSQMSLNNTRNGFRKLTQKQDIYGASNTGLNMPQPLYYNNLAHNSSSSFHPIQPSSITRSTLSVFTHPNGRQQVQKRSLAVPDIGSPYEQGTVTTTTSPNGSSDSSPKQQLPLPPIPPSKTALRGATSSMELSNSFRSPAHTNSMRTFGIDTALSQSQLYSGPLF